MLNEEKLRVSKRLIKKQKEIKDIKTGKEEIKLVFANDMIMYMEKPKYATKKLLELMN